MALHPEMPDILFFLISRYFYNLNFNMCIYTVKKQKFKKKKNSSMGMRNSTERPKSGVSGVN